ncbi:MAG: UDP-N-acetylglucosamine 2-epimerase (non-hydrolyzing) [Bacteroidia bacterium]
MIKIVTVIGARPQIIKAAALSRAVKNHFSDQIEEVIIHTGQHYDANMSQVFFDELQVPLENYNLNVGSGSHAAQTAKMLTGIEDILKIEKPDTLLVYGDTNSTLAGAIAASKIHIPVVHVEAGLRSFNKKMPEEINRITCDHCSTLLFSPTKAGYDNLVREGFPVNNNPPFNLDHPKIYHCGDVMYDNSLYFEQIAKSKSRIASRLKIADDEFVLVTVHRAENTDDKNNLNNLFASFDELSKEQKIKFVIPLHPRTRKLMETLMDKTILDSVKTNKLIKIIEPVSFLDMIALEASAILVATDSGGVQKEAYFFKKPCIILREQTEWTELVECGAAKLTGADQSKIKDAYHHFTDNKSALYFPQLFGDGKAAEFICKTMIECFSK